MEKLSPFFWGLEAMKPIDKPFVIITGASSGIGRALTVLLANVGYPVVAIGRNLVALQCTRNMSHHSDLIQLMAVDLANETELDKCLETLKNLGNIKFLIHCAATTEPHVPLNDITRSQLQNIINLNVMAPIFLTQKLVAQFVQGGRVLFIGSDYVGVTNKMKPFIAGAYGVSKSALRVAVEYFRVEQLAQHKMRIGYLNPGSTNTPMFDRFKNSIIKLGGVFSTSGNIAESNDVAKFIYDVLASVNDQDYQTIDWDFRVTEHHNKVLINKSSSTLELPKARL